MLSCHVHSLVKKGARFCEQLVELEGVEGGRFEPASGSELKSSVLVREISELDRLARSLDAAQISEHRLFDSAGGGVVTNLGVVVSVLIHESVVPTCAAVRAWLAAVEAEAAARPDRVEEWRDRSPIVHIRRKPGQPARFQV
jgi:hypothetical protein